MARKFQSRMVSMKYYTSEGTRAEVSNASLTFAGELVFYAMSDADRERHLAKLAEINQQIKDKRVPTSAEGETR